MFKKMLPWLIMILIAITLIALAAFILWDYMFDNKSADQNQDAINSVQTVKGKSLTAKEINANTLEMNDIITNLSDPEHFVKLSLAFELSDKKAKEEFELISFKIKDVIMKSLADMSPEKINGSKGQDDLCALLLNKINSTVLTKGKLKQIYITNFYVQ